MTTPLGTSHRLRNALQSIALLAAMAALAGFLGWTLFGPVGLWAAMLGPLFALLRIGGSSEMILRLTRAQPLAPEHAPGCTAWSRCSPSVPDWRARRAFTACRRRC
ncbi:MAG: hypothetical protein ACREVC_15010 [Burkholderiales bacterium]